MWSVSGLSCRKFGSCHSHIDDGVCLCSHWNHLFLSSSFMCIYAMNWMIFFFVFCFLFFSCCFWWSYNNIVAGICQYIFVFLCYYFYLFVLLGVYILWFVCIFYYFLLIYAIVKLWRTGWYVANGRPWRTGGAGEASEV